VSPELAHAFGEMQARVRSIALFHEKLYQSDDLAQVGFAEYIQDLSRSVLSQFEVEPGQVTLEVEVDPVRLGVDRAIPAGLIANELISNALKHAFPDHRRGKVWVRVSFEPPQTLVMTIADDGIGMPAGATKLKAAKTLGLQLVSTLTRQLEGTVDVSPLPAGGTSFTVRFPAPNPKVKHGPDSDRRG
jgi:two-component sensor histidine kinase